ncbi:hypothetical protein [Sunxiuqinia dokdonensis]|uniref:Uncharacterized protein n=1 Tax=Sunxiuqinia dokdonensis TaxID=1409788 RepID=A0A0L8V6W0_9BACT|nr:hypothetical protein [Sunxiuqinia dokdonensis]KOH44103.1 hypothetical protein NC99_30960 [Sunxiuqinia dokdonensis]
MTSSITTANDPTAALAQLLEQAGIRKIAYIDDRFSIENLKEEFIGNLKFLKKEKVSAPSLDFVNWSDPDPIFNRGLEKIWEDLDVLSKYEHMKMIYEAQGKDDDVVNISPVISLKSFMPKYVETFSPEQWEKERENFFSTTILNANDRVLCLFDMELKDPQKNGIYYLLETLNTGDYIEQTCCAVFSHLISVGKEFNKKKEWCTTYTIAPEIAAKFYPISKESFSSDPKWSFIEGIKNVILVQEVEKLKDQSIEILKNAQRNVIKEIREMSPETYNHIVQRTSIQEGIWEMNTLFRVSSIIQDSSLKDSITDPKIRSKFNSSIATIRSYDRIVVENEQVRWSEQAIDLRNKEIFDASETVNLLHYPLANGDIFQLGKKQYILLVQPCNISIRKKGSRDHDFEVASIVEIVKERPLHSHLYVEIECKDLFVKFPRNYSLRLDVLDLAIFDSDGVCKIDLKKEELESELFHFPLQLRYKKLRKHYLNCKNKLCELEDALTHVKKLRQLEVFLKPVISLDTSLKGLPQRPYNRRDDEFNFNIRRIRRLKEPYASDALQKFMLYLSRNGFDHDYTKNK